MMKNLEGVRRRWAGPLLALLLLGGCASAAPHPAPRSARVPASSLSRLMAGVVNQATSEIAYQIFHNRQAAPAERFERMIQKSKELSQAAERMLEFTPPLHPDRTEDYVELAVTLRHYASGLRESAVEGNLDQAVLWFWHVKNTCMTCHEVYRFGEQEPLRKPLSVTPRSND